MVESGTHTLKEVEEIKRQKKSKEEIEVCRFMIKAKSWENDPSCKARDVYLCYASALNTLGKRD